MNRELSRLPRDRKFVAAILVAAIIVGVQLAQSILSTILYLPVSSRQIQETGVSSVFEILLGLFSGIFTNIFPFAVGVFLCLWLLTPLTVDQRAGRVIKRSLLAAAAGTVVIFVTSLFFALLSSVNESQGLVYGWVSAGLTSAAGNMGWAAINAIYSAGTSLIYVTPLTTLACLLVWLRLRAR